MRVDSLNKFCNQIITDDCSQADEVKIQKIKETLSRLSLSHEYINLISIFTLQFKY